MLGGTADVRFIVVQVHTPEEEARLFASLQDLTVWKDYESGATIYENQDWLDRIIRPVILFSLPVPGNTSSACLVWA